MNEVIEFLNDCGVFFLATVDGDQPKVRPYGFVMDYDGKLCLCTNNKKPSYAQMKANPAVEISATKDGKWYVYRVMPFSVQPQNPRLRPWKQCLVWRACMQLATAFSKSLPSKTV